MRIASRHSFVWPEQMTAPRAGERGAEVRGGGGGGGIYLFIYPHTRPSLDLDNDKNYGVVEPPQKGEG